MNDRDVIILRKIIQYSREINETITRFNLNFHKFTNDHVVKNAIAMCILQIGELSGKLSDEFKESYNKMPWRDIIAMRNRAAHTYESVDMEIIWNTVINKIPELKSYCESIIKEKEM